MKPEIVGAASGPCMNGCKSTKTHSFGTTTNLELIYCSKCAHKNWPKETIFERNRDICQYGNCLKRATFGTEYLDKARCKKHRLPTDILSDRKCCSNCKIAKGDETDGLCKKCRPPPDLNQPELPIDTPNLLIEIGRYEDILRRRLIAIDIGEIPTVLEPNFIPTLFELKYITRYDQFPSTKYNETHSVIITMEINRLLPEDEWIEAPKIRPDIKVISPRVKLINRGYAELRAASIIDEMAPVVFPGCDVNHQYRINCPTFDPKEPCKPYILDCAIFDRTLRRVYVIEIDEHQHKGYIKHGVDPEPTRRERVLEYFASLQYECRVVGWNPDSYKTSSGMRIPSYFKKNVFKQKMLIDPDLFRLELDEVISNVRYQEPNTWNLLRYDRC
jgi:hypothetical protein